MTAEQGKPLAEAHGRGRLRGQLPRVVRRRGRAGLRPGRAGRSNPTNRVLVLRQPVGVAAAITPWNFPAAMMTRKLGPALAAGCTSVVKPAERDAADGARSSLRAIEDAGVPAGRREPRHLALDRGMVADTLFGDPRVRKISFTGSTEVGKELIRRSADQVKRLSLELGGHAPYLIFDDADLDAAVEGADRVEVPQRRPDLRLRQPHLRAARGLRRVRRACSPRR